MIRYLIMDVDGTLTDGKIYMGAAGEVMKAFDIKDGCGIKDILPRCYITPIIITARESKILTNRCDVITIILISAMISKRQIIRRSLKSTPPIMSDVVSGIHPEGYLTMA